MMFDAQACQCSRSQYDLVARFGASDEAEHDMEVRSFNL